MASLPLHASSPDARAPNDSSRPLSGLGTSRQTRRLQLRNANFPGTSIPSRKVTPKALHPSSHWSSISEIQASSDIENVSPAGDKDASIIGSARRHSGILQEIGNSTIVRSRRTRPRLSSSKFLGFSETSNYDDFSARSGDTPLSMSDTVRPRSVKTHAKISHPRRSTSTEVRKYVEHLEAELMAAQAQISAVNSPSINREHASRVRNLNVETKQLQEELAGWEIKYEQRVQEEVNRYHDSEILLRSRIRTLEQEAEETKFRIQELETQLDTTTQTLGAVETANVNLEKRIELMSELLATSPNKIDLYSDRSGSIRHLRQKSMLPRFPIAGSSGASPERQSQTQPTSPALSMGHPSPAFPASLDRNAACRHEISSDAESVASDDFAGNMTSAGCNPWNMPPPANGRFKPVRRMRKFGAGSFGPKPLILPVASYYEPVPTSAPLLQRRDSMTPFAFSPTKVTTERGSPTVDRRRSSIMENDHVLSSPTVSEIFDEPTTEERPEEDTLSYPQSPPSAELQTTTQDFSSLGPSVGRNLMEELRAARTWETDTSAENPPLPVDHFSIESENRKSLLPSGSFDSRADDDPGETSLLRHGVTHSSCNELLLVPSTSTSLIRAPSTQPLLGTPIRPRLMHQHSRSTSNLSSMSSLDRLRQFFGDLWQSPVVLAKHLVQTAQSRMKIPHALLNVQWWIVGMLLGPMARRKMLVSSPKCTAASCNPPLEHRPYSTNSYGSDDVLAYGSPGYMTPPTRTTNSLVAGKGKKRSCAHLSHQQQQQQRIWSKHNPWLWIKFSLTLAFAVGLAFRDGPGSLLKDAFCASTSRDLGKWRRARRNVSTPLS